MAKKQVPEVNINDPEIRRKLKGMIEEIANSMTRTAAERDFVKDVCNTAKELGIQPRVLRSLSRMYNAQTFHDEKMRSEEVFETYETLFPQVIMQD